MCTLALYCGADPQVPLLVAANRDEFLARPTAPPRVISLEPWVVAGQDLEAGGTWLGINEHGMVVAVLNRRSPTAPDPRRRSRGLLCLQALQRRDLSGVEELLRGEGGGGYNPFTLVAATVAGGLIATTGVPGMKIRNLAPGMRVITNLDIDDPSCPRIARWRDQLATFPPGCSVTGEGPPPSLQSILAAHSSRESSREPGEDDALCVHRGAYGTRSSSIIAVSSSGSVGYWHAEGPPCSTPFHPVSVPLPEARSVQA